MKLLVPLALAATVAVPRARGACNVDEHHPENGGYHIEGIAGYRQDADGNRVDNPDAKAEYFYPHHNATWAPGVDYPDGSSVICTGMFCSEECATNGCPVLIESTTCAQVRFCYDADSGSDVWELPSEVALANCDFSEATRVCDEAAGSGETCCNYAIEEDADLGPRFFASKAGCEGGQRAAVNVADYDESGDQCYSMGLTSSRINKCTCTGSATLVEPCHSEFIQGCLRNSPDIADGDPCCEAGNCLGRHQDINDPIGKQAEESRKLLCNDGIPGNCVVDGVADCCTKSCTECGIDMDPFASWAQCSSGNRTDSTGSCGYSGFTPFTCNFSQCAEDHPWHPNSDKFQAWINTVDAVTDPAASSMDIVEIITSRDDLSTLGQAISQAGLADALSREGPFTVFAPNEDAIDAFGQAAVMELLAAPERLAAVLKYHVVNGKVMAADVAPGMVETLNGAEIEITVEDGKVMLNGAAEVITTDIVAANGVIHVIDAVITPPAAEPVPDGKDIAVDWYITDYTAGMTASVGDTVIFTWEGEEGAHNVFIHPSGDCSTDGATEVGLISPASHKFTEAGTITFSCDVFSGGHCRAGQIVTFTVSEATADDKPAGNPAPTPVDNPAPTPADNPADDSPVDDSPAESPADDSAASGYGVGAAALVASSLAIIAV